MRMLVTGGAGFIGSNFIHYILEKYPDYSVINYDNLTYAGNLGNLQDVKSDSRYCFVKGSISDREMVKQIFENGIDTVVNFAAESHVDRSILNPGVFVETNIVGTQVLLDAANHYGVSKFVQVSTDEVYGTLGPTGLFTEHSPLAPNSPYSASKASADLLVRAYHETYELPINISRCSNNYGPYQFPEKLIPLMIISLLESRRLPLYGDGLNVRDWLHVMDHCSAIDLVLHSGLLGEVYNVGGNNERTNLEIVHRILHELGGSEQMIEYVKDRPGHDRRYAIDSSKIQSQLGWQPKYHFEDGIRETIRWYDANRQWWERIRNGDYLELQFHTT